LPLLISIYLLYSWIKQDGLKEGSNVELNFFGSLAIMTYFSNTTNDYNLVTTYPLIFYSWMGMYSDDLKQAKFYAYTFFIGIVSILGYRFLWHNQVYNLAGLHVLFQIYWLFLFTRRASFG